MKETITQFEVARWALQRNVEGLSHEESLVTPEKGGNCMNWVVGHLISTYDSLLGAMGAEAVGDPDEMAPYERGCETLDPAKARRFEELLADFERVHARFVERLAALAPEELAAPAPFSPRNDPDETIGSLVVLIAFHQAYHVGQTGVLRRVAGRAGALA